MLDELLERLAKLKSAVDGAAAARERPAETQLSRAVRDITAAICLSHLELSNASFLCVMVSLSELADATKCEYFFGRQVLLACREDPELARRLNEAMLRMEGLVGASG